MNVIKCHVHFRSDYIPFMNFRQQIVDLLLLGEILKSAGLVWIFWTCLMLDV